MKQEGKWDKVFHYSIGCLGLVGVLATVITLLVALVEPARVVIWLQTYASLPTPTPLVIIAPSPAPLPTSTPYPTYTREPTYTPLPTYTPYPTPTPLPTLPTATPSPIPLLQLPFLDDFDNGPRPEWQPISGNWRMVNGQYTSTGSRFEWVYSVVGDPNWRDYVIETDYSLGGDSYAQIAILVRAGGTSGLGLSFQANAAWDSRWCIWREGEWSTLAVGEEIGESGHIRIEVKGDIFTASVGGLSQFTITDNSTTAGYVGVGIRCRGVANCPSFDNFQVARIGE